MKGKILVIEDNVKWQDDIRLFLENAGYYVEVVDNLDAAIEKVKKENYNFITIDMQLNEGTGSGDFEGWDILENIKKLRLHDRTPTMIITTYSEEYLEQKKIKGVEGIFLMSKMGWDPKEFIRKVDHAVSYFNIYFKDDHRGH